jgi:multidrug efflux pump subunit AcrA (membrane-fusion protein)
MKKRLLVLGLSALLALSLAVPALGGPSNPIAHSAASAKSIAKKALKKSKKALKKAKKAQAAADDAQTTADNAQASANQAQNTADAAQASANQAQTTAEGAQTSANQAQASADAAQASANQAQATANSKLDNLEFVVGNTTANDSNSPKTSIAVCPGNKVPSGGGFIIAGDSEAAARTSSQYFAGWVANAGETTPTAGNWSVTATAECVDDPPNP